MTVHTGRVTVIPMGSAKPSAPPLLIKWRDEPRRDKAIQARTAVQRWASATYKSRQVFVDAGDIGPRNPEGRGLIFLDGSEVAYFVCHEDVDKPAPVSALWAAGGAA